nr:protein yippee-like [Tanacetum cinerariifolium]
AFHCRHGKAYLFDKIVNVTVGEKEDRMMITGLHTVADIFCVGCGSIVGWKYEAACEKGQKKMFRLMEVMQNTSDLV